MLSGHPAVATTYCYLERLHLLDPREPGVALLDAGRDRRPEAGVLGQHRGLAGQPVARRVRRRGVGVQRDQRDVVGPAVADDGDRGDERAADLEGALDVRRGHVLAARADDDLLLAVHDRDVAVVVDAGTSPVCSQPSPSIASAVRSGSLR